MRASRVWRRLLGVEKVVVERVECDEDRNAVIAHLRTRKSTSGRCSRCGTACPGYDKGVGRRRWRALDPGTVQVYLEADLPRVRCPEHHVVVSAVPRARPGSGFTRAVEQTCVWLVKHLAKTDVAELLRVAFRTVDDITLGIRDGSAIWWSCTCDVFPCSASSRTILGLLGCGMLPIFGGPASLWRVQRHRIRA